MIAIAALVVLAATVSAESDTTALERWLPTITSIGGVLVIALVTAFKIGGIVKALQNEVLKLREDYKDLKAGVKGEFVTASQGRKGLREKLDGLHTEQVKQGKDIEHQAKSCSRRHPPTPPREWMPGDPPGSSGGL